VVPTIAPPIGEGVGEGLGVAVAPLEFVGTGVGVAVTVAPEALGVGVVIAPGGATDKHENPDAAINSFLIFEGNVAYVFVVIASPYVYVTLLYVKVALAK
jgi:hypothetical protein